MPRAERREQISLVIADDHPMVRRGLSAFVETAPDILLLEAVASGLEATRAVGEHAPDVLLLDLLMPEETAEETVRSVKSASPRTQVVILTSYEGSERVAELTRAGAISYVLKDSSPDELIDTIRRANRGEPTITPRVARTLLKSDTPTSDVHRLTPRELEVLQAIASGHSNRRIAEDLGITERTVKSHVGNVLSKLYLDDRTQAAVFAWREGVVDRDSTSAGVD